MFVTFFDKLVPLPVEAKSQHKGPRRQSCLFFKKNFITNNLLFSSLAGIPQFHKLLFKLSTSWISHLKARSFSSSRQKVFFYIYSLVCFQTENPN
jgi:hypothetical protein